jgi:ABC-type multidrug transport system ATPase subunit
LATALVLKPELLILDAPTANLDLASQLGLIDTLNELNAAGTTVLVSTHDAEAIPELADRIVVVSNGALLGEGENPRCPAGCSVAGVRGTGAALNCATVYQT